MLNIDNKISSLPIWHDILQSLKLSDVCWCNQNNVHNNKMVFSADSHVFIKLLRQKKGYGDKKVYQRISQQAVDTVRIKQTVA